MGSYSIKPSHRLRVIIGLVLLAKSHSFGIYFASFLFGTANKELLNDILEGTDLKFAKWAVNELVNWDNQNQVDNVIRIHGTKDKLIPWRGSGKVELIEDGEHFMIVDRA